ncbi:MAG: hypothetical protein ACT4QD_11910 [Acidobacteriota bacterium]
MRHAEVVAFVRDRKLNGRGIGWIDAHLLASALVGGLKLRGARPEAWPIVRLHPGERCDWGVDILPRISRIAAPSLEHDDGHACPVRSTTTDVQRHPRDCKRVTGYDRLNDLRSE